MTVDSRSTEARRQIDDAAHRRILKTAFVTYLTDRRPSHCKANPKTEFMAMQPPADNEVLHRFLHRGGHLDRSFCRSCNGNWRIEDRHQPVAPEARYRRAEPAYDCAERPVVVAEDLHQLFGLGARRDGGKAPEIAEYHDVFARCPARTLSSGYFPPVRAICGARNRLRRAIRSDRSWRGQDFGHMVESVGKPLELVSSAYDNAVFEIPRADPLVPSSRSRIGVVMRRAKEKAKAREQRSTDKQRRRSPKRGVNRCEGFNPRLLDDHAPIHT